VVRKAIVVMAGIMMVIGMLVSPPQSEAATNSCSLDGTYVFSGLGEAGGFFEVLGSLVFTPSKPLCIAGTFTGFVTIQHQGQPVENFIVPPTSIYNVTNDGRFTGNSPVLNLVGEVSMVAGDPIANAVSIVAAFNTGSVFAATLLNKFPVGLEGPQALDDYLRQLLLEIGIALSTKPLLYFRTAKPGKELVNYQQVIYSGPVLIK